MTACQSWRRTCAEARIITRSAPARFSAAVQALAVAPLVWTLSTSQAIAPTTRVVVRHMLRTASALRWTESPRNGGSPAA